MQSAPARPVRSPPAWLATFLMAVAAALSACGGGSGSPTTNAPSSGPVAPVPAGQRAQATLGGLGGDVVLLSSDGSQFVLSLPAGALNATTTVALSTQSTISGQNFNLRFEPAGLVFESGSLATITISLPAGVSLAASTAIAYDGAPMPYTRLPDGRIQVNLGGFASGPGAVAALAKRLALLAPELMPSKFAQAAATPCGGVPALGNPGDGGLSDAQVNETDVYGQCMIAAINSLAVNGQYAEAVRVNSAIAAYLQFIGAGGAGAHIAQAGSITCTAYKSVLDNAQGTTVTTMDSLYKLTKPILFWEKTSQQLGANCTVSPYNIALDAYQTVINSKTTEAMTFYASKKGSITSTDSVDYAEAVKEAKASQKTIAEVKALQPSQAVKNVLTDQIEQRAQPGLLDAILQAPWQRCRDSGNYDKLIELMETLNKPQAVKDVAQYCATQLSAQAKDSASTVTATLDPALGGTLSGGTIGKQTMGSINVAKDGRLALSGPINKLQCPVGNTGGTESLLIKFNGTTVSTQTSAPYLNSALELNIASLLQAANINPDDFSSGTLTLERTGTPCGGFWGAAPVPLLTLGLGKGICAPPAGIDICVTDMGLAAQSAMEVGFNGQGDVLYRDLLDPLAAPFSLKRRGAAPVALPADFTKATLLEDGSVIASNAVSGELAPHALIHWKNGTRTNLRQWPGKTAQPGSSVLYNFFVNRESGAVVLIELETDGNGSRSPSDLGWCARTDDGVGPQYWACRRFHMSVARSPSASFNAALTRSAIPSHLPNPPSSVNVGTSAATNGAIKLIMTWSGTSNGAVEPAPGYRERITISGPGAASASTYVLPADLSALYENMLVFDAPAAAGWASTISNITYQFAYLPSGIAFIGSLSHLQWRNVTSNSVVAGHDMAVVVGGITMAWTGQYLTSVPTLNRFGGFLMASTTDQWHAVTLRGQPLP